jgi:hypothetical protein
MGKNQEKGSDAVGVTPRKRNTATPRAFHLDTAYLMHKNQREMQQRQGRRIKTLHI